LTANQTGSSLLVVKEVAAFPSVRFPAPAVLIPPDQNPAAGFPLATFIPEGGKAPGYWQILSSPKITGGGPDALLVTLI
jgi:hypothetical protein